MWWRFSLINVGRVVVVVSTSAAAVVVVVVVLVNAFWPAGTLFFFDWWLCFPALRSVTGSTVLLWSLLLSPTPCMLSPQRVPSTNDTSATTQSVPTNRVLILLLLLACECASCRTTSLFFSLFLVVQKGKSHKVLRGLQKGHCTSTQTNKLRANENKR